MISQSVAAILERWHARLAEYRELRAHVDGEALCVLAIRDLEAISRADDEELLTLEEAARRSGYSADHLGRLVREQKIANMGKKHAPLVRWRDVPRKPGLTRSDTPRIVPTADRRQIVRAVIHAKSAEQ